MGEHLEKQYCAFKTLEDGLTAQEALVATVLSCARNPGYTH
jgi:hypothetical protein